MEKSNLFFTLNYVQQLVYQLNFGTKMLLSDVFRKKRKISDNEMVKNVKKTLLNDLT